jgi:hypothetical protein
VNPRKKIRIFYGAGQLQTNNFVALWFPSRSFDVVLGMFGGGPIVDGDQLAIGAFQQPRITHVGPVVGLRVVAANCEFGSPCSSIVGTVFAGDFRCVAITVDTAQAAVVQRNQGWWIGIVSDFLDGPQNSQLSQPSVDTYVSIDHSKADSPTLILRKASRKRLPSRRIVQGIIALYWFVCGVIQETKSKLSPPSDVLMHASRRRFESPTS